MGKQTSRYIIAPQYNGILTQVASDTYESHINYNDRSGRLERYQLPFGALGIGVAITKLGLGSLASFGI